ncbi:MAG: hypothetical protein ACLPKB_08900 [Xanthobacteraceae bacterium]
MLFASDAPFGPQGGAGYIRAGIEVMQSLDISEVDREKICYRNALNLFGFPSER